MNGAHKKFIGLWLGATFGALGLIALLNALVDPPGAYPRVHLQALEPLRQLRQERVYKAELARRGDWQVAILGSSRAKGAMPAIYPYFATNRTCNLSVDAARVTELKAMFDYVRRHNRLEHVILCLDFYMFTQGADSILDFTESRFSPDWNRFRYHCKRLLSKGSLDDTRELLKRKRKGYVPDPQEMRGFLKLTLPASVPQRGIFTNTMRIMARGYAVQTSSFEHVRLVGEMAQVCRDSGIRLDVAILPVHALDLEMLHTSGRWADFGQWQKALADALTEAGDQVALWDFSSFEGPPAEPVPAPGDHVSRMRYYFENSHCTPALGTNIVGRILGAPGESFGTRLTAANVEAHMGDLLRQRLRFVESQAADAHWAAAMAREAMAHKPKPRETATALAGAKF